ncbi:dihydroxyacetone kinase phosphoryl donor subunit DhaM [[Eubacterium] cellulosolvens]
MLGIVIVSHSKKLAEGVKELIEQMSGGKILVSCAGGSGSRLGTDATMIMKAIEKVYSDEGVLIFIDFGSAILSAKTAITFLESEKRSRVLIADAPLVEGSFVASVEASMGKALEDVLHSVIESKNLKKV